MGEETDCGVQGGGCECVGEETDCGVQGGGCECVGEKTDCGVQGGGCHVSVWVKRLIAVCKAVGVMSVCG